MSDEYWLAPVGPLSWPEARALPAGHWLWADTGGMHLDTALPGEMPMATHAWGWGDSAWIRLRIDPDISGGVVVGALLQVGQAPPNSRRVTASVTEAVTWPENDGRAELKRNQDHQRLAGRKVLTRTVRIDGGRSTGDESRVSLSFIEMLEQ